MVASVPETPYTRAVQEPASDPAALGEALAEAVRRISAARRPVILAGVEIHRFGLQDRLLALAEGAGIPMAGTMSGKSVVSERHPLFVGTYEGAMGREEVTQFVEESDCVLILGEFMTDINLGIYTANLEPDRSIYATSEFLRMGHHHFDGVLLPDFIDGLIAAGLHAPPRELPPPPRNDDEPFQLQPQRPLTIMRMVRRLNQALDESMVVIADPGDALFATSDLVIRRQTEYLSPAYYTSMGFAVPAALGVMVARPDLRAVVLVGDGAFQMTGMELSSIVRYGYSPIIIVLDNKSYATEALLQSGRASLQRRSPLAVSQAAGTVGRRGRLRGPHRGAVRRRALVSPDRHKRSKPDSGPPRSQRLQHRPAPAGQPPWAEVGRVTAYSSLLLAAVPCPRLPWACRRRRKPQHAHGKRGHGTRPACGTALCLLE